MVAEGFEAVEFFQGAAVQALGLGLVAEEQGPGITAGALLLEAFGEGEGAVLRASVVAIEATRRRASRSWLMAVVKREASSWAARRMDNWERAMRSSASSSWELTG